MSEPRPALLDFLLSAATSGCHCSCLIHESADQSGEQPSRPGSREEGRERAKGRVGRVQAAADQSALRTHVRTSCFLLSFFFGQLVCVLPVFSS